MKVNITLPVYNEEKDLVKNTFQLLSVLRSQKRFSFEIVIADNASTDRTSEIAWNICSSEKEVQLVRIPQKGRGRALKHAWITSNADIVSFMDIDLSTDLRDFPLLIEAISCGSYDLAVGSRLLKPFLVQRGLKRELISRCYNALIHLMFNADFSDAQCGFKAMSRRVVIELLPLVEDNEWFLDTELLLLAERLNFRIFDMPVKWIDDPDSRVGLTATAVKDIKGLLRMRRTFAKWK